MTCLVCSFVQYISDVCTQIVYILYFAGMQHTVNIEIWFACYLLVCYSMRNGKKQSGCWKKTRDACVKKWMPSVHRRKLRSCIRLMLSVYRLFLYMTSCYKCIRACWFQVRHAYHAYLWSCSAQLVSGTHRHDHISLVLMTPTGFQCARELCSRLQCWCGSVLMS